MARYQISLDTQTTPHGEKPTGFWPLRARTRTRRTLSRPRLPSLQRHGRTSRAHRRRRNRRRAWCSRTGPSSRSGSPPRSTGIRSGRVHDSQPHRQPDDQRLQKSQQALNVSLLLQIHALERPSASALGDAFQSAFLTTAAASGLSAPGGIANIRPCCQQANDIEAATVFVRIDFTLVWGSRTPESTTVMRRVRMPRQSSTVISVRPWTAALAASSPITRRPESIASEGTHQCLSTSAAQARATGTEATVADNASKARLLWP